MVRCCKCAVCAKAFEKTDTDLVLMSTETGPRLCCPCRCSRCCGVGVSLGHRCPLHLVEQPSDNVVYENL